MNTSPPASISAKTLAEALAAAEEIIGSTAPVLDVVEIQPDWLLATTTRIERLGRWVDALRVAAAAEIDALSGPELGTDGLAARLGCRNANELLQRVTQISGPSAGRRLTLGAQTRSRTTLTGSSRPPAFTSVAAAMRAGEIGVDSASAIVTGLSPVIGSSNPELWLGAERELVQSATGRNPDELNGDLGGDVNGDVNDDQKHDPDYRDGEPCSADETKLQAALWRAVLDPDGVEPAEERALRRRSFRIGRETDGMVAVSGQLVPIAAAMLTKVFDAYSNPRTAPAFLSAEEIDERELTADPRSRPQQHHDILVGIIDAAALSARTPSLGGAAPTVLVTVRKRDLKASAPENAPENASDLASGCTSAEAGSDRAGFGFVEGAEFPISMRAVRQLICTGGTQEVVLSDAGRIVALGSAQRCFTAQQRRAITVRDGGCLIPGCSVPAAWCEIHHVIEAARGGPTHPDNGVLLCWFHHRTIDTSGWQIRTLDGVPQVKAPPWIRVDAPWRSTTKSPTRIVDGINDAVA